MTTANLSSLGPLGGLGLGGTPVPLAFDAGAVVALDATAWYDLFYLRNLATPYPLPTLATILNGADARWYDLKSTGA